MTLKKQLYSARMVSSVAATMISLACGTNYVYSAWAPQFADRLLLSATESNLIGLFGNLGMYSCGVPIGMFVDLQGPRPAVVIGSILLGLGYWPLHMAYEAGHGSVPLMCFFSFLTGLGGCTAFAAAIKTSALNWPHHRGTATAFPLAAFGLSAFFFALIGSIFFPGSPGKFLELLAFGTFAMTFTGFFFLQIYPHSQYHAVAPAEPGMTDSQELRCTLSAEPKTPRSGRSGFSEPGMSSNANNSQASDQGDEAGALDPSNRAVGDEAAAGGPKRAPLPVEDLDETASLISRSSSSSLPGDVLVQSSVDMDRSHRVDIRGMALLKSFEFWQLFSIMGILSGIGLMTINNIGNDATALWKHYDDSIDDKTLVLRQQLHVSILSIGSFSGRLLSGVGSDFLVKVVHASRIWCLVIAAGIFSLAQICALNITNPHLLGFVSGFSGLGYGFLFGVYPSIVAESFGIHGLSQNWGFITLSPVISSNPFNLFYGYIFDRHSVVEPDGTRTCTEGLACYRTAYLVTLCACGLGVVVTLWVIWHQRREKQKESIKTRAED
ncbi:major facilitator superfamily domain-containing protein [Pseudomassariella vexata]|uniref:Major facilitator superfamily domain-containing protein n=1 Tax=Pseudomassariella vexata TaxID=1141098 RepID=A0A1Y2DV28_9PEZI|nr:major facilitator superfamily domain-containing protein [Pseudomassariella vexata]ORY63108.1 major facilitator superfamily domain-containing protein [Pseudomassariella vexata]